MKILTWNINGIRASKVPLKQLFDSLDADIICLQETKVTRDMLDERSAIVEGYSSYYSFSNVRTGYSGVATYVKDSSTPVKAEQGLSGNLTTDEESAIGYYGDHTDFTEEELELLDKEGRTIITQHQFLDDDGNKNLLTVINVYCPRADPEREDRKTFKLRFYQLLQVRAEALLNYGSHVIILGDVNTSHQRIDTCDPSEPSEFVKHPGRLWLNQLLWTPEDKLAGIHSRESISPPEDSMGKHKKNEKDDKKKITRTDRADDTVTRIPAGCSGDQFVDSFRYFHPGETEAYTCWNTMIGARETNYGTRIDYIFADKNLASSELTDCNIMPHVMGSDHCPVKAEFRFAVTGAKRCPPLCTKYFPEFVGVQTKLSSFFSKGTKRPITEVSNGQAVTQNSDQNNDKRISITKGINTASNVMKSTPLPPAMKKGRLEKQSSVKKQSSLVNFFNSKPAKVDILKPDTETVAETVHRDMEKVHSLTRVADSDGNVSKPQNSSSAWKNLLKGPPPAPLCKGHKEPCLLRTVKKDDSLNKGRQFYVCPRPEGLRTNPQARCDHFEWVEKKKKPK